MPGVNTWLRLVPSEGLTIVVLANADNRLSHTVADEILHLLVPSWKIPQSAESLHSGGETSELPSEIVGTWKVRYPRTNRKSRWFCAFRNLVTSTSNWAVN